MQRKLSGYGQRHPSSAVIVFYAAKPRLTSSRLPTRLGTPETQRYVNAWATVRRASSNSTKIVGARIRAEKGTIIAATAPIHHTVTRHVRSEKQKIVNSMEIMPPLLFDKDKVLGAGSRLMDERARAKSIADAAQLSTRFSNGRSGSFL